MQVLHLKECSPVAKITGDNHYSIITDYLGTPVEAYNSQGKKVWSAELDVYGRVLTDRNHTLKGDIDFIPFRYQGQYHDTETGLYYNRFRYYDPTTGNYTQQDPIGLQGGNPTLYAYVHNPHSWIDPLGLTDSCVIGAPEPEVQAFIQKFEALYPNRKYQSGHKRFHSDGRSLEIDFETDNVIIEFKKGKGKGLTHQVKDRIDPLVNPNGKVVIGVPGKRKSKFVQKDVEEAGGLYSQNVQDVLDLIFP